MREQRPVAVDPPAGNIVSEAQVRTMFDRIAPIYDAMNTVMTAGLDRRWRQEAAAATGLVPGSAAVDVACGTGALTVQLSELVGTGGRVVGIDASPRMLRRARARGDAPSVRYELGDALALPLDDASVHAATIAFGLRNVADYGRCLAEMARVTRPGGRVVVLEIATPTGPISRSVGGLWLRRVVPLIGRVAGEAAAYAYLPESVRRYPRPGVIAERIRSVGLVDVRWRRMALGMVTLHVGRRP